MGALTALARRIGWLVGLGLDALVGAAARLGGWL
jgi:hypothetical protein